MKGAACYGVAKAFRNMQEAISKLEVRGNKYEFSGHISNYPKWQCSNVVFLRSLVSKGI
jgi:hypothetical protein